MDATARMAERLMELEIRLAYQDRTVAALDDVVRSFAARVEELERALTTLRAAVGTPAPGAAAEPPPHY